MDCFHRSGAEAFLPSTFSRYMFLILFSNFAMYSNTLRRYNVFFNLHILCVLLLYNFALLELYRERGGQRSEIWLPLFFLKKKK